MAPLAVTLHKARDTLLAPRKSYGGFRGGTVGGFGGDDEDDDGDGLSKGEIAGIVIGSIAIVALIALIIYCLHKKRASKNRERYTPPAKVLAGDRTSGESEWHAPANAYGGGPQAPPPTYMQEKQQQQRPQRSWTGPWGRKQRRSPSYWMERRDEQEAGVVR